MRAGLGPGGTDLALDAVREPPKPFRAAPGGCRSMTIRLTVSTDGATTTVLIEGQLTAADLPDVRAACESAGGRLRLDLSDLKSADADGVRALRWLSEKGAELGGANPYVRQLLREGHE